MTFPAGVGFGDGFVDADFQAVSPGYFDTLGLRLTRGRLLDATDTKAGEAVAVVSEAFGAKLLNGASPIGHRLRRAPTMPWITVVGVIADIRRGGKAADINPQVYLSAAQTNLYPTRLADVAVQLDLRIADIGAISNALRQAVWAVDKDQPISNVRTLEEVVATDAKNQRFQATLIGLFAALALLLAVIGIHGVVSYVVTQRTPEIGIRMALGADRWVILRWLLGGTFTLVLIGAAAGAIGAASLSKYVASLLFQVKATDAWTYVSAAVLLSVVAMCSAALAARRAMRIDPVRALRSE
jgi:putative ABC transport system permease protein